MSRYQISEDDLKYAAEFEANPLGTPSPGLQRVMNLLRGGPKEGKYVPGGKRTLSALDAGADARRTRSAGGSFPGARIYRPRRCRVDGF